MSEFKPDAELTMTIDETATGTVVNNLATTIPGFALDARQGKVLDDKKLDKAHVANNLTVIEEGWALDARQGKWLNENKLGFSDIANDLETDDVNKVLSAAQGKAIVGRTAPNAEKLGGKAPEYYIQPRNLLDNSDFTNPVNQRGEKSYKGVNKYTIDRWYVTGGGDSTTEIADGIGVILKASAEATYFAQRFSSCNELAGKYVTLAFNTSEGLLIKTGKFPESAGNYSRTDLISNVALGTIGWSANGFGWIDIGALKNTEITLYSASLFLGEYTAETLPPYVPRGYAAELAECMRYYQVLPKKRYICKTEPNGGLSLSERFLLPMRMSTPTITQTYFAFATLESGDVLEEKGAGITVSEVSNGGFIGYTVPAIISTELVIEDAYTISADL